jgi:hypothetical protein
MGEGLCPRGLAGGPDGADGALDGLGGVGGDDGGGPEGGVEQGRAGDDLAGNASGKVLKGEPRSRG